MRSCSLPRPAWKVARDHSCNRASGHAKAHGDLTICEATLAKRDDLGDIRCAPRAIGNVRRSGLVTVRKRSAPVFGGVTYRGFAIPADRLSADARGWR